MFLTERSQGLIIDISRVWQCMLLGYGHSCLAWIPNWRIILSAIRPNVPNMECLIVPTGLVFIPLYTLPSSTISKWSCLPLHTAPISSLAFHFSVFLLFPHETNFFCIPTRSNHARDRDLQISLCPDGSVRNDTLVIPLPAMNVVTAFSQFRRLPG